MQKKEKKISQLKITLKIALKIPPKATLKEVDDAGSKHARQAQDADVKFKTQTPNPKRRRQTQDADVKFKTQTSNPRRPPPNTLPNTHPTNKQQLRVNTHNPTPTQQVINA